MAKREASLIDIIVEMARPTMPAWRDDEVLDELLETSDSFTMSDGTPTATARGPLYYWGAHSPASQEFKWNFSKWG